jgi:methyl-accepting chemotaxis protein
MQLLDRLTIKTRLLMLAIGGSLLLILFGAAGLYGMNASNAGLQTVYADRTIPVGQISGILEGVMDNRIQLLQALRAPTPDNIRETTQTVEKNMAEISSLWQDYLATFLTPEEKRLAEQWGSDRARFVSEGLMPAVAALRAGRMDEASRIVSQSVEPLYPAVKNGAAALIQLQLNVAKAEYETAVRFYVWLRNGLLAVLVAAVGIGGLFAFATVRRVTRSVGELELATHRLADGDLTMVVDESGADELGRINRAFNQMATRFRKSMGEVTGFTSQLAAASEELSAVSEQTHQGISRQQSDTDLVATAMHEMSTTVQEVARNTASAADAARQADESAESGTAEVRRSIEAIGMLATEVDHAAQVIQRLSDDSRAIGAVLDVIRSIAEQTNLLALNAAIEAARAGEQGRGFAVVADEVRTLASRTQQSTQEIQEMITRLQAGAGEAVEVMVRSRSQARTSVEQAGRAGSALDTIARLVSNITGMNTQIASAVEEQGTVAEDINRNVVAISQISAQTATGARQTAAASGELAQLAAQLQSMVNQFRM